jgi:hypothetical protein
LGSYRWCGQLCQLMEINRHGRTSQLSASSRAWIRLRRGITKDDASDSHDGHGQRGRRRVSVACCFSLSHTAMERSVGGSLLLTHWALLPLVEVCAVSNICMQTFCRPLLPRPAKARPCREGVVAGVVSSLGDVVERHSQCSLRRLYLGVYLTWFGY